MVAQLVSELVEQRSAELWVGDGSSPEKHRELDLVAAIEESRRLPTLRFEIMFADLRFDTDLFEANHMLVAS